MVTYPFAVLDLLDLVANVFVYFFFFFFQVPDIQSFRNVHEAKFIAAFVRYLILQGYQASQITVLATYKGQMFYFHKVVQ